jgi:hypothetical protein
MYLFEIIINVIASFPLVINNFYRSLTIQIRINQEIKLNI